MKSQRPFVAARKRVWRHKPETVVRRPSDGDSNRACDFKLILRTAVTCVIEQLGGPGVLTDGWALIA